MPGIEGGGSLLELGGGFEGEMTKEGNWSKKGDNLEILGKKTKLPEVLKCTE